MNIEDIKSKEDYEIWKKEQKKIRNASSKDKKEVIEKCLHSLEKLLENFD